VTPSPDPAKSAVDEAAIRRLIVALRERGYAFTAVTPETHRLVLDRDRAPAQTLRDVFGWNRPFAPEVLAGLFEDLRAAGLLEPSGGLWRSRVRVAEVEGLLLAHSSFPTDEEDAVFLGPDSYRFVRFLDAVVGRQPLGVVVDFGAGAGVGGLCLASTRPVDRLVLTDVNPRALAFARANAAAAGTPIETHVAERPGAHVRGADLIIANPPFIADSGKAYSDGGGDHGAGAALDWAKDAVDGLAPAGRLVMYTGSPIVAGRDRLRERLGQWATAQGLEFGYEEIDPDIFGSTLDQPAYADVERIAAVGIRLAKAG